MALSPTVLAGNISVVSGHIADGLVFAAAPTTPYWQAEVFAIVWGVGILLILAQVVANPALLRRRLRPGLVSEPEVSQKLIATFTVLCVLALFAVSLLDHELGWSNVAVPVPVVALGDALIAAGSVVVCLAFRANPFAASTVTVEPEQAVISSGPYAVVRNPLYSGGLLIFLGAPVALGSWWGLVVYPPVVALIILRALNEERYLTKHLPGYREYCATVTHRLIPYLW